DRRRCENECVLLHGFSLLMQELRPRRANVERIIASGRSASMRALFVATALIAAGLSPALAQQLLCPPVASVAGKPCETFHFHVQLFRPDTREFVELYGINQFASAASCEHARAAQLQRNMAVLKFL